jgi:hypothetical protein
MQPPDGISGSRNVLALIILTVFAIGVIAIGLFLLADRLGTSDDRIR